MKKNSWKYNESNSSDTFEDVIDLDTGVSKVESKDPNLLEIYQEMVRWAENRRGSPFLKEKIKKQYKAFAIARNNKIQPADLKNRWIEFEQDKFWAKNGFDWADVVYNFNKKR